VKELPTSTTSIQALVRCFQQFSHTLEKAEINADQWLLDSGFSLRCGQNDDSFRTLPEPPRSCRIGLLRLPEE
jgi:hypothetical protein